MLKYLKILLTLFFIIILLLGFALPLNPVGNWYQQFMPSIGSKQITDITFLDSLTGFAIASKNVNPDTSSILRTTDGGDNWQIIFTQGSRRFSRVKFINSLTGFISGGSGGGTPYLYKSSDGGNSWNTIPGATLGNAFWNDMSVLNEDTIWLVDANSLNGGVFFTSNGGVSWQPQLSAGSANPNRIYMFNARIGFANRNNNIFMYRTTNSGANWIQVAGANGFLDIKFVDSLTGWKCNNITGTPYFDKTTDGGLNWFNQIVPFGGIIITPQVQSISIINRDTIWSSGADAFYGSGQFRGVLYRTTNAGNTWLFQIPDTSIHISPYSKLQFINKLIGWAYSSSATGIHTTLGGDPVWLTGIKQISNEAPKEFKLYQNFPNPFNPSTNIRYELKVRKFVKLKVFDVTGKEIAVLVNQAQTAGTYEVDFSGNGLASGVYFYSLIADGVLIDTRKMLMIK